MMIWHIFRKDWKLLWPLVLAIAFAHATSTALFWLNDHDKLPDYLSTVARLFPLIAMLGSAILTISVMHVDPIPGDRQDWLTRPIRHSHLLAAKFLFVLLAVLAPVFLISASEALSDGFSLVASIAPAFGHTIALFVVICLPTMMLGVITGNAMEAIVGIAVAVVLAVVMLGVLGAFGRHPSLIGWAGTTNSGVTWMQDIVFAGVILVAAVIILPVQYFRRYTAISRRLAILLWLLALLFDTSIPWNVAFSSQHMLISNSAMADGVAITYDPSLKQSSRTALDDGVTGRDSVINLPIRADGISAGDVLLADRTEVRIIADGKVLYHQSRATGDYTLNSWAKAETQLRQNGGSGEALHGYQVIVLPIPILDRVRSRDVTLEMDYSLSLLHRDATATFAALNDSKHSGDIGWCKTKIDDDGDEIVVQCVRPGRVPVCGSAVLDNPATNRRDPETFVCAPDYNPFPFNLYPDELTRFWLPMRFKDIGNSEKYPVNESQLASARVNLATYQAAAHFTRHVVIHNIRLSDWEAASSAAMPSTLQRQ